ncbi:alpha/beta hydrolase [Isoptericola sp. b441]|uniref:Alpha/beta hydrolase n=1 Tax=Actinotalea lenta TaxID=3064654 RepID=A0ABT9D8G9_9CELL|nr:MULTISPECIES: alpha/beta hydrolase [unclassified Isoptericola]MDO8106433.1 alpha/beta hydrolase [Isoptericola sp. b441]MDO8121851.1 alpha/beta hydrolase [Isoptericola sp. b490]
MRTAPESSSVLVDGPWQHRFVAANGARFHVAEAGDGPLVVLLHGFPQMWWAWRHHIPRLAEAGYRVAAMDLRGSGASDKPPQGYDVPTLTRDVAGVIRSLGRSEAVVVGHGLGGTVAWSMPGLRPGVTRAVAAFSASHPARLHTAAAARPLLLRPTTRHLAFFQLPWFPERRLTHGDLAARLLREWGAGDWPTADEATTYSTAMQVPFAAHSSMETLRWLVRSTPRVDGRRYLAAVREPLDVPVLQVHGDQDRCLPLRTVGGWAGGRPYRLEVVSRAGHFLPEEAPEETGALLLDWLGSLA